MTINSGQREVMDSDLRLGTQMMHKTTTADNTAARYDKVGAGFSVLSPASGAADGAGRRNDAGLGVRMEVLEVRILGGSWRQPAD